VNKLYNATDFERAPADFYPTPPDLTRGLIDGLAQAAIALPGPILEPCCGAGVLANVLTTESGLKVVGSDLYPDRYAEAAALYATTAPVDARDAGALLKVIEMTGVAALVTNPPYGRDHHRIAEAFLRLLRGGSIRFAALLVPHQFDAAGQRGPLFSGSALCATDRDAVAARVDRRHQGWRDDLLDIVGLTAEPRPSALPGTVWVKRRPSASTRTGRVTSSPFAASPHEGALGRSRKNRTISRLASGPLGSVYDPAALPPDQA
jgi:hypothetical protein